MNQSRATKTHCDHNRESIATTVNQLRATKTQLKPTTKSTNTHHKPNIIPPPATTTVQPPPQTQIHSQINPFNHTHNPKAQQITKEGTQIHACNPSQIEPIPLRLATHHRDQAQTDPTVEVAMRDRARRSLDEKKHRVGRLSASPRLSTPRLAAPYFVGDLSCASLPRRTILRQ
uniref:Uncharacterized protein n=1 Tax=Fagus sylvatica TaxID=28930 RepID=A0A2N9GB23_FAGSY